MAERRIFFRQRVADAEIHHGTVVIGQHRVADVRDVVTGLLQHPGLAARVDLDDMPALEQPVHQVDVIRQRIDHRCGVRVSPEHRQRLRA
jgi:hypothetical protein